MDNGTVNKGWMKAFFIVLPIAVMSIFYSGWIWKDMIDQDRTITIQQQLLDTQQKQISAIDKDESILAHDVKAIKETVDRIEARLEKK